MITGRLEHDWLPVDLPPNVELDDTVFLHSAFAFRHFRSERPAAVRVGEHTAMYDATMFELGPAGEVDIGRYGVLYGPQFVMNSRLAIGDFAYISYEVYIADHFAPRCPADGAYGEREPASPGITVGDDCWIGVRSALLAGASLGRGVIVGAGTVVDFAVPDYAIVAGNPASIVGWARPGGSAASGAG